MKDCGLFDKKKKKVETSDNFKWFLIFSSEFIVF